MENLEGIIAMLALLLAVGLPILTALLIGLEAIKSKHKERMGLINQGIIPPDTVKVKANPNRYVSLRNGIVLVCLGIGIFVGFVLSVNIAKEDVHVFYIISSSIVMFLGLGYLLYFFVTRKAISDEKDVNTLEN